MQFQSYLEQLQQQGQYRQLREVETARQQRLYRDGQAWINFTSNDYLGLGQRSIKMDELERAIQKYGAHLGSSRLVSGHSTLYAEIEQDISEAYGFEGALLLGSGYEANLAVFQMFKKQDVVVFSDVLNHASIIDGIQLARVKKVVFPHLDYARLKMEMAKYPHQLKVIVTDTIFSTNGHMADLHQLRRLKSEFPGTLLVVDDAHGFGLGYGTGYENIDIVTTSLSKAMGAHGGLILCSYVIREMLINTARPLIYSNCLPTMNLFLIQEQFRALQNADFERRQLHQNIQYFNDMYANKEHTLTAIKTVTYENVHTAKAMHSQLLDSGFWVSLFRPPTVATPALRMSLSALHEQEDIMRLHTILKKGDTPHV